MSPENIQTWDEAEAHEMADPMPEMPQAARTLPQLIRSAAACYGNEPMVVLVDESGAEHVKTFAEVDQRSSLIARGLLARGVGKGSRVGMLFANGPEFAVIFAAITRIGAIAVPISTMIRANELVRVLRQSDIGGLIVQRAILANDIVERLCDALPQLRDMTADIRIAETPFLRWIISSSGNLPPAIGNIDDLVDASASFSDEMLRHVEDGVHPTDQMIEIYTSGAMALPKGVRHLHGPVLARSKYLIDKMKIQRGKDNPAYMPMFWVGGLIMALVPNWIVGARTTCTERIIRDSRMSFGSVLAKDVLAQLKDIDIFWALGMTETLGPYSYGDVLRVPGYPICSPLDHIADGFEVRVADEDDLPVGDGESGEIQVRGYAVTPALHKIERAEYFTPDGYYRTGDMGRVDGARIHFIGRNGDMIKTVGSNVAPAEVELEMQSLDGVDSAYVVGLPDHERGQLVVAAVVPHEGAKLDFAAIEATLRERLSSYKVPRAYVEITREEVPVLHSNKVARREMETLLAKRLGREG